MGKMKYTEPRLLTSALLTIDTQCDFVLPDSAALIPGAIDIIPNMTSLLNAYRQYSLPIIHIVRLYMPDGSNVDLCRKEIIEDGLRIIVPNTPGAELVADLKPDPHVELDADLLLNGDIQTWGKKEFVIYKPRWGAFYKTPLDSHLRDLGVSTLVICGCNFPNCPRATIYEASERDYKVVLVEDAVSGIYEKAKEELRHIGVRVWPTRKLIDEIGNQ
ncbi:MAG: isochorismatase family cysteine hydrolase [Desulfobacterales bacterium]|jgi:nicotinamidase-related amidase